jgi:hypothetical protein
MPDSQVWTVGRIRGVLCRNPTIRKDEVRSLETGLLAKRRRFGWLFTSWSVVVGSGAGAGSL